MSTAGISTHPVCPRCGYDLGGAVAAWNGSSNEQLDGASCPLDGVCSECGLRFNWSEIMDWRNGLPRWLFEHSVSLSKWIRFKQHCATTVRSLSARRLWQSIPMAGGFRPLRLGLLRCTVILFGGCISVGAKLLLKTSRGLSAQGTFTMYGWPAGPKTTPNSWQDRLRREFTGDWSSAFRIDRDFVDAFGSWIHPPTTILVLWVVAIPLGFWLMPLTLRRAHVRPGHLVRIWVHGAWMLPLFAAAWTLKGLAEWTMWRVRKYWLPSCDDVLSDLQANAARITLVACALLAFWWWSNALKHYLRMPQPRLVAACMVLLSFLLAVGAGMLVPPLRGMTVELYSAISRPRAVGYW